MKLAWKSCLLGNWPSKWLFRMARTLTLAVQLGILPAMLLLLISKRNKNLNSKFVRLPVNWLSLKLKNTKLVKLKWVENISPWNLLPDNINVRKWVQFFPNSFGTFPEKLLRDKLNITNFLMRPIEGGTTEGKFGFWLFMPIRCLRFCLIERVAAGNAVPDLQRHKRIKGRSIKWCRAKLAFLGFCLGMYEPLELSCRLGCHSPDL